MSTPGHHPPGSPRTEVDERNGDEAEAVRQVVLEDAELERDDFDSETSLRGPVTAEDEPAGTVEILGITVTGVVGVTSYDTTQSAFHAAVELGTFVEAEWDPFTSTDDPADSLSIEE